MPFDQNTIFKDLPKLEKLGVLNKILKFACEKFVMGDLKTELLNLVTGLIVQKNVFLRLNESDLNRNGYNFILS